ncbi:MAG: chromosomal replication initiator protein DnaA [Deltaproteobacteria bacterium]|nr:chromosomal replication initiator protein DnaA [Deltaproteobacteria bacterium]
MVNFWEKVKASLREQIPSHSYGMWIEPLRPEGVKNGSFVLSCPNSIIKQKVNKSYVSLIESEIHNLSGKEKGLVIEVSKNNGDHKTDKGTRFETAPVKNQKSVPGARQLHFSDISGDIQAKRIFQKDFTFDNFVVGMSNDFAYSAALSLASKKNAGQNALYLLSKTGLGKSHLSQAIGQQILANYPEDRVCYITAEDFAGEMIHAFRHNSIEKFKKKYQSQCDVLLLEDVHFLTGKERTQLELALALDYLLEAKKKIIFTSCYLPSEIPKMSEQLRSRISCGLISNIEPPNFSTRVRILRQKSKRKGYRIPSDVTEYLAGELSDNVRQLESGLIGVAAKSSLLGAPIDLNLAESVVKNLAGRKKSVTVESIKKLVCSDFSISMKDIVSRSRRQEVVRPRQVAIYLSRKYTDQPLQAIGKSFNRQHATAIHAINAITKELKIKSPVKRQVDILSKKLESGKF